LRSAKLCFFRLPQAPAMIHPPVSVGDIAARCSRGWFSHGDTCHALSMCERHRLLETDWRGTWLSAAKQRSGKAFPKAKSSSCSCQHTASRRSNRKTSGDVFLAECTATNKFCMSAGSLVLTLETFQHSRRSRCKPRSELSPSILKFACQAVPRTIHQWAAIALVAQNGQAATPWLAMFLELLPHILVLVGRAAVQFPVPWTKYLPRVAGA